MEKSFKARDGVSVYYTLNQPKGGQSDNLIIIGHGLTGNRFEYIHQITHRLFVQAGYDVIRIGYYTDPADARKLDDCTVQTHADDLNDLIAHVKGEYHRVFYAGHSYGGLTALLANPEVDATAFWDSSYVPDFIEGRVVYIPELDCYTIGRGVDGLVSKAMVEEAKSLTIDVMKQKAHLYKSPSCVIIAGDNTCVIEQRQKLYDDLSVEKNIIIIEGATHCFFEAGTSELLADKTLEWFKEYL